MAFDPSQFGATPVAQPSAAFDPSKFGATPVSTGAASSVAAHPGSAADKAWAMVAGAGNTLSSVFGGKQLGTAIGNSVGAFIGAGGQALQGKFGTAGDILKTAANQNNANFGKVAGDTAGLVALPVSMMLGSGAGSTVTARLASAALKYGGVSALLSGGKSLANGGSAGDAAKAAATGGVSGAIGGAGAQGVGEGIDALLTALPARLVKNALPKLDSGNLDYALKNTSVGTIPKLLNDSEGSVSNLGEQVQTILRHPEYASDTGAGDFALQHTLNQYPDSEYTADSVVSTVKKLVPAQAKLVDKVANGTATLAEKNLLRSNLDYVVRKVYQDAPDVAANKQLGATFSNALRAEVQSFAPETQPVFANLSKEIDLRNALDTMSEKLDNRKAIGLYDLTAALGGFTLGNVPGAMATVAAEKALRSPAVGLAAAKGIKASLPALEAAGNAARGPAIPAIASATGQPQAQ